MTVLLLCLLVKLDTHLAQVVALLHQRFQTFATFDQLTHVLVHDFFHIIKLCLDLVQLVSFSRILPIFEKLAKVLIWEVTVVLTVLIDFWVSLERLHEVEDHLPYQIIC